MQSLISCVRQAVVCLQGVALVCLNVIGDIREHYVCDSPHREVSQPYNDEQNGGYVSMNTSSDA